ncbi:DNA-methyltransferase [Microbacterium maritypicum]|uniref:DNA-methyltransferase n=1 Tax=Microbacterium maritypicum TaxID=33918 RepID=UPI003801BFA1
MGLYHDSPDVQLHHGDALHVARTLPDGLARAIVTSPPYFGLRDYGEDGQIGAESSVGQYVARMVELFRELRRVLADDGTLWLNLGDSFSSAGGKSGAGVNARVGNTLKQHDSRTRPTSELPAKNLLGVPWRVAFALQDDGWILRSDIIWHKPNPMPESVTDRPTKSHEYLLLFTKCAGYYYDANAIAEDAVKGDTGSSWTGGKTGEHQLGRAQSAESRQGYAKAGGHRDKPSGGYGGRDPEKRNKRTVWTVPTVPFPGSHFAVYPPDLIRPCVRAGSEPGDIVLDPFSGSGTTGAVANFEGRRYVGIDLNRDYLDLSLKT